MDKSSLQTYLGGVIDNMPNDWLRLTTHRLDIYDESQAKTEFLEEFEALRAKNEFDRSSLANLPTAFDYIRLGHPLSCLLEWSIAKLNDVDPVHVITFSSVSIPIMAVLRKNLFANKNTLICHSGALPSSFDTDSLKTVYGYDFELRKVDSINEIPAFDGSAIFVRQTDNLSELDLNEKLDFLVNYREGFGSTIVVNGKANEDYISEIQHVRRRETVAMTPVNCVPVLQQIAGQYTNNENSDRDANRDSVSTSIAEITGSTSHAVIGSSGLSIQYAIVMGLIDHSMKRHQGKGIRIVVPTNCYGGTNDQARRVAATNDLVEVVDLLVDGGSDMVQSIDTVLASIAAEDAIPLFIAEIPTNPRVEVPDMEKLRDVLSKKRSTSNGSMAVPPVFILDQTFCPNVSFLREQDMLSEVQTISYVSGSKFPSGGLCTAGYCVANNKASHLMKPIQKHIALCDNEATDKQLEFLAAQMPSMNQRIQEAYLNTRSFVSFIEETLPEAKINFVSEELAAQTFTPSVFSLDLPTKGANDEEREAYKREMNLKLINKMIDALPSESKYCVSYGQLKGCYWTIPATSTQGTTKEGDKDYIVRVALSGNMNLEGHKQVFKEFVRELSVT